MSVPYNNNKTDQDSQKEKAPDIIINGESETGSNQAQNASADQEAEPKEKNWEEEAQKYRDMLLRATAELENTRKRLEREKADVIKFANESIILALLPVIDNLERALEHVQKDFKDDDALLEGVRMTQDSFKSVMEKFGVKPLSAMGEKFDPNFHEAVMQQEDPDVEANTVLQVIQRGYLLRDRLLRPAMVVVSKKDETSEMENQIA